MRVLLDTAVFVFALQAPERFSKRAASILQDTENILELSVISVVEIALKASRGKLNISSGVLNAAVDSIGIRIMPYTSVHAHELFSLPLHHRDPFDRQIIAQALAEGLPVVTPDELFRSYRGLKTIW